MTIEELWQQKTQQCKNLKTVAAAHNFTGHNVFSLISCQTEQNINENTKFQAASLSKLVGTIVCALFLQTKNISLSKLLTGEISIPLHPQTTLKHLLSHSAGINVPGFPGYAEPPLPALSDIINGSPGVNTESIKYILPFGKFAYSGGGYCLAQEYIERLSRNKISLLADELLFRPLGLKNTTFNILQNDDTCAKGYDKNGSQIANGWHLYPESLAAGLWTTPLEYLHILNDLINGFYGNSPIIHRGSAQEILTPVVSFQENGALYHYALGVRIFNHIFYHSGNNRGYKSLFAFDLQNQKSFVIMSSDDNAEDILDL